MAHNHSAANGEPVRSLSFAMAAFAVALMLAQHHCASVRDWFVPGWKQQRFEQRLP